jgi:hypothetical protein
LKDKLKIIITKYQSIHREDATQNKSKKIIIKRKKNIIIRKNKKLS